jgi:hypothetical protein
VLVSQAGAVVLWETLGLPAWARACRTAAGCHVVAVTSLLPIPPARGRVVLSSLHEVDLGMLRGLVGYDTME